MQLVDMDFTGIINAASLTPCSKYDFGMQLVEELGLNSLLIRKGSIADHSFSAPRFYKLDLDIRKLSGLGITSPNYKLSIRQFAGGRKERDNHY